MKYSIDTICLALESKSINFLVRVSWLFDSLFFIFLFAFFLPVRMFAAAANEI